ncbi:MAG: carbamoyltransferase [Candidatus Wallbacteria bacterium]|nr:carbamoyltransferase [Candidatus Wallbacteria bacterium]
MINKYILGISAFYHDSAACLLADGKIVAAAQEERFTRIKHHHDFPKNAIQYCLSEAGILPAELESIAFYDKPFVKFERLLETYLCFAPAGLASFLTSIPPWISKKLWLSDLIRRETGYCGRILFAEHHESHAASAFFPSPFERAAFLTVDGVGEWASSAFGTGEGNRLKILSEQHFPHSLGLLYSAFTFFSGFKVNSGEYKIMGLAPFGEPKFVKQIYDHLLDLKEDGSFRLNMEYFDYCSGLTMTNAKFASLFGGKPRQPEAEITQREMDLARSIQEVTEEIMLRMARHVKKSTREKQLCLAGGVALNCVANGKLLRSRIFDDIWIQPAAGDAGGALGAAFLAHHHYLGLPAPAKNGDLQKGSYLGPAYSQDFIRKFLDERKLPYVAAGNDLPDLISEQLIQGKVIGWFNGRMEFGPRSLGSRSIIADSRNPEMQKKLNLKIKFREGFRPFAPSVLAEETSNWFDLDRESPYMLLTADVLQGRRCRITESEQKLLGIDKLNAVRSSIPAVTHLDYSARIQTVNRLDNPDYYALISAFFKKTGCPVIINTSFNLRGEPIVCSPLDAYKCFMRSGIDVLVLENFVLYKESQPEFLDNLDWRTVYELD